MLSFVEIKDMSLNAELNAKIKIRDNRRKAILDPNIDQLTIVGMTKGLRRLEKEINDLIKRIENGEG
jgi:hypothetical protein|tara:strand:- start:136 stop:336 length:201 start_codon:yes stop_codon:yes gene_type:complete